MSRNIVSFIKPNTNRVMLAVFPHADDIPFVAGGLFQLLQKMDIRTKMICLTPPENEKESIASSQILGIDDTDIYNIKRGELAKNNSVWTKRVKDEIERSKPFAVVTFDPHGITGNSDHIECSMGIFRLIKEMHGDKPKLIWRISDSQESGYFDKNKVDALNVQPTFHYFLRLPESIKKLKAIYSFKEKFNSLLFKLRILEWYLLDHKELYYLVDFSNINYKFDLN